MMYRCFIDGLPMFYRCFTSKDRYEGHNWAVYRSYTDDIDTDGYRMKKSMDWKDEIMIFSCDRLMSTMRFLNIWKNPEKIWSKFGENSASRSPWRASIQPIVADLSDRAAGQKKDPGRSEERKENGGAATGKLREIGKRKAAE